MGKSTFFRACGNPITGNMFPSIDLGVAFARATGRLMSAFAYFQRSGTAIRNKPCFAFRLFSG